MTPIGRCRACRHFDGIGAPSRSLRGGLEKFFDGYCLLAEMPSSGWGDEGITYAPDPRGMLASSIDGSGYRGSLLVKASFGCVCWREADLPLEDTEPTPGTQPKPLGSAGPANNAGKPTPYFGPG